MVAALAKSVVAHQWRTIAIWLDAAVLIAVVSPSLSTYTTSNQPTRGVLTRSRRQRR